MRCSRAVRLLWRRIGLTRLLRSVIGTMPGVSRVELGKPNEKKLQLSLKRLLASDTLDRLTEVLPYTKEEFGRLAQLPGFDWEKLKQANAERAERAERRWVERIFRLPPEAAESLAVALDKVKQGQDMSDGEALGALAQDWLGGQ